MRTKQRACCKDVLVMRGANCLTDLMLVRAKLKVALPHKCGRGERKMLPFAVHWISDFGIRNDYRNI